MPASSWLIGTVPTGLDELVIEAPSGSNGQVAVPHPTGPLYLHDSTGSRSFLTQLSAAILAANDDISTCIWTLQRNRLLRVDFDVTVSINWGDLAPYLGFDNDVTSSDTYTADRPSTLLWVPGLTEISSARLGRPGTPTYDSQQGGGGSYSLPVTTSHNFRVPNDLEWRNVANSRVWLNELGGEHYAFWQSTLLPGHRFAHYRGLVNDESSATSVGLTGGSRVGPYVWRRPPNGAAYDYTRAIDNVESRNNVRLPAVQVLEIS